MPSERTPGSFGEKLRDARERRGISLREISNATKISVGVLEALERNDVSRLPGGIFGRAFVRSYAIEVGLDPEGTIQEFVEQFPNEAAAPGHTAADQVEDNAAVESTRRMAGTFLWLILISVPIAGVLLYVATVGRPEPPAPAPDRAVAAPVPDVRPAEPAPAAAAEATPAASGPATAVAAPAVSAVPAPPSPPAAPVVSPTGVTPGGAARTTVPAVVQTSGDQLAVSLTVKRPCWVSATVDGQKAIERLLQPGDQQTLTVRRELVLTAGDASAIALQFNGADARPLGKSGEVVTARFNLTNFKDYLQAR